MNWKPPVIALFFCQLAVGAPQGGGGGSGGGCSFPFAIRQSLPQPEGECNGGTPAPTPTPSPTPKAEEADESGEPAALEIALLSQDGETPLEREDASVIQLPGSRIATSMRHTLLLSNIGESTASRIGAEDIEAPYSYAGGEFPGEGGDCEFSLAPEANCKIVIEVNGLEAAVYSNDLSIEYFDDLSIETLTVTLEVELTENDDLEELTEEEEESL